MSLILDGTAGLFGNVTGGNISGNFIGLNGNGSSLTAIATGSTTARSLANRFADVVNVKDFGAVGDGVTDDTAAIQAALIASQGKILIFENKIYLVNQLIATGNNVTIIGNGATIKYTANINDSSLKLQNCNIENVVIDGNGFSIGNNSITGVKDSAPISATGDFFNATNVTVKNLTGLENKFQYGIVCKGSTTSNIVGCKFTNIKTHTDTANTGGFCGGYVIYQHSGESMTTAAHKIDTCVFTDIYTLKNAANQLYPDSDGIRCYFYDMSGGSASYVNAVKQTVIKVSNCSFVNVLKSACKLQDCNVYIENCRVTVDDLKDQGQTDSYVGFRYQSGHYVKITDCSVVGKIRSGTLLQGDNSFLENFYFGATAITSGNSQSLCWIGDTTTNIAFCGITNVSCSGTDFSLDIYGANHVVATNCNLVGEIAIIHCDRLQITNCKLDSMINNAHYSGYSPYLNRAEFSNCEIIFAEDGFYANNILSSSNFNLSINDCKITNCRAQFIETLQPFTFEITDTYIEVTSQYGVGRRLFDMTSASTFYMKDVRVLDNRTTTSSAELVYANSSNENLVIDGFEFIANASSNYNNGFYLAPSTNNIELRNLTFNTLPASAYAISISQSTNPCIDTIRCNYTNARIQFINNGKAIVNMLHGTLTPSPNHIVKSGIVTVSEYNTTFV